MAKGLFTQGICVLLDRPASLDEIESELHGFEIECPRHGARFDVRTGAARCAPAYEPTAVFPVKVEDGAIYTRDDRWD